MHDLTIFPRNTMIRSFAPALVMLVGASGFVFPTRAEPIGEKADCLPANDNSTVLFHGELIAPFGLTIDAKQRLVITSDHQGEWKPKARYLPAASPSSSLASMPIAVAPEFLDLAGARDSGMAATIPATTETLPLVEHQHVAPIPEPKTLLLVSIGLLLGVLWRWCRASTKIGLTATGDHR
jgi:hypothetical protein